MFGTVASRFNDDGVTALYQHLRGPPGRARPARRAERRRLPPVDDPGRPRRDAAIVPPARARYLAEVAEAVRDHHRRTDDQVGRRPAPPAASRTTRDLLPRRRRRRRPPATSTRRLEASAERAASTPSRTALLDAWPATVEAYSRRRARRHASRDREVRTPLDRTSRCRAPDVPRVALPRAGDDGELLRLLREENLPGRFPFTAGVFAVQARRRGPRPHVRRRGRRRSAPTGASTCWPRASRPPGCRPRSTRSRSTASTPTSGPTSTARSATRACRSPPSTT